MSGVHADVAPSFLGTVVECPGALALSRPYRNLPETEDQRQGRIAHLVAMRYAMGGAPVPQEGGLIEGVRVTAEMVQGARLYAEALEGFAGNPEQTIPIPRVHPTLCFGTPDFWQYSPATKTLRITDYKFGHKYVEVFENYQLMAYASGIIDMLVARHELHEFETVVDFMLVQPRCYSADSPVRTWTTSATNLRAYINVAANQVEAALAEDPPTKAGTHCLFCPARSICKTAHVASTAILEYAGEVEAMSQSAADIGLRLALINDGLTMLKALATGLEEQALELIRKGKVVPHFKIEYTKPRETWAAPVAEVKALGVLIGKPLTEEKPCVTPKQAITLGVPADIVKKYSHTPNGSAKLIPDRVADTARIFSK